MIDEEKAKRIMMEFKGKCAFCEHKYPDCEIFPCPTDEEIIKKIMEVENDPEERAEAYILREDVVTENDRVPVDNGYGGQTVSFEDEVKKGYLDGYKQGYEDCKPKWHDLRKDPNDLPKDDRQCLCFTSDCYFVGYYDEEYDQEWHFDEFCTDKIDAWCELPKFEEE